jgi:hypothetical protein
MIAVPLYVQWQYVAEEVNPDGFPWFSSVVSEISRYK